MCQKDQHVKLFPRPQIAGYLKILEDKNQGVPISSVAINMWKSVLEGKNLTNENKTPEQITDAAKEFRKLFIENSYLPRELVKEIKIVDSTNTHIALEKQINMFPEAGEFFCQI